MFAKSGSPTWEAPLSSLQQQAPVLWLPVGFDQWVPLAGKREQEGKVVGVLISCGSLPIGHVPPCPLLTPGGSLLSPCLFSLNSAHTSIGETLY